MLQAISSSNASLDAGKWVGGAWLACLLAVGGRGRPGSSPPTAAPILYTQHQSSGSVMLGYGTDMDPDLGLFFSGFEDANKKLIFPHFFLLIYLWYCLHVRVHLQYQYPGNSSKMTCPKKTKKKQ
jgi:hypothetical protein